MYHEENCTSNIVTLFDSFVRELLELHGENMVMFTSLLQMSVLKSSQGFSNGKLNDMVLVTSS